MSYLDSEKKCSNNISLRKHLNSRKRPPKPPPPPIPTTGFHHVNILHDIATGQHHYTGVTQNLQERLIHNYSGGAAPLTFQHAPWYIETAIAFRDKQKAYAYERHLQTGAGRAYVTKNFSNKSQNGIFYTFYRA